MTEKWKSKEEENMALRVFAVGMVFGSVMGGIIGFLLAWSIPVRREVGFIDSLKAPMSRYSLDLEATNSPISKGSQKNVITDIEYIPPNHIADDYYCNNGNAYSKPTMTREDIDKFIHCIHDSPVGREMRITGICTPEN